MINFNDINVLSVLKTNNCINNMKSFTIKQIEENAGLSNSKIRYTVKPLVAGGFISEGYQEGNASTYWITTKGLEELRKAEGE